MHLYFINIGWLTVEQTAKSLEAFQQDVRTPALEIATPKVYKDSGALPSWTQDPTAY